MAAKKSNAFKAIGTPTANTVLRNLPFVLFLCLLAVLYIANAQYAESSMRDIRELQSDIKKMRWEYMSSKAELMYQNRQSEVQRRVEGIGLSSVGHRVKRIELKNELNDK